MKPTPEQIAAFADGELDGMEQTGIEAAIAADPALQQQIDAHRALRARLGSHFAGIAAEPVPDRLAALLVPQEAHVVDFAEAKARRRGMPGWTWAAVSALAASMVLAVTLTTRDGPENAPGTGYADQQLAAALEGQLVADQPSEAPVRVLLSFRDSGGGYCRAFTAQAASGIACRDADGWKLRTTGAKGEPLQTEYRQAGSAAEIMAAAQSMASGPALDAEAERLAKTRGWQAVK
ncbi:MAG: hypothetical protein RIS85_885 [Pseudomonadota bacterium]